MDSDLEADGILPYLESLKISAFTKVKLIKGQTQNVTIGPNASFLDNEVTSCSEIRQVKEVENSNQLKCNNPNNNSEAIERNEMVPLIPFRQVLKEYEILRQRKVQEALHSHSLKFELFSAKQSVIRKQNWIRQQQKNEEKELLYEKEVMIALKKYDEEKINEQKRIDQYEQQLEDERKKVAAALEAKKKENELLNQCFDNQSEFQSTFQEIMMNIKSCEGDELIVELSESWKHCKDLNDLMMALMEKCKESISEHERDMTEMVLNRMKDLKNKIHQVIESYQQKKQEQAKIETEINNSPNIGSDEKSATCEENKCSDSPLEEYIGKSQLEVYTSIIDYYQKYIASFRELSHHENFKQFRFDLKKAVNLSVNTISAANSDHLHDKYMKLSNLLHGKNVIIGDLQITASKHPEGIKYCIDLLAKKFVLQGDLMVSGNPESAFSFATIIVSIWNESPEFGKILLAYFFKECTYLVPFYPPRLVDQTDQEYYESQGYRYADGKVEDQDKFLKRMTGTMRLYFAILLSSPNKSQNQHPYFISHAWIWIVSVLKLKPRVDITATMFHTFFETVGFQMLNLYQKQFSKLMKYFIEDYLPSMKKIDSGGPVARLDCLIQEFKNNGNRFSAPKGLLSCNYW